MNDYNHFIYFLCNIFIFHHAQVIESELLIIVCFDTSVLSMKTIKTWFLGFFHLIVTLGLPCYDFVLGHVYGFLVNV